MSDSQDRYWDRQLGQNPADKGGNAQPAPPLPQSGLTVQATAPMKSWVVQLMPRPRRLTQTGLSAGEFWWKRPAAAFMMVPPESNLANDALKAGPGVAEQTWDACDALRGKDQIELYVQVYDEASRDRLKAIEWATVRNRVRMLGIENVSITASVRGLKLGAKYTTPTFVLHRQADETCASEIAAWLKSQMELQGPALPKFASVGLPRGYTPQPRVMELWWPETLQTANR